MTATVDTPKSFLGTKYLYVVTLTSVNDTATAAPKSLFNFSDFPLYFHVKRNTGDTLRALYTLDDDLTDASKYILTTYGNMQADTAVVFDFAAQGYRITKSLSGAGATTVYVASPVDLIWTVS